jgi:hypothetical protein
MRRLSALSALSSAAVIGMFAESAGASKVRGDPANSATVNETSSAACGHIQVKSDLKCTLEAKGSCTAKCSQGARFSVACEAECAGQCSRSADSGCRTDCVGSCTTECAKAPIDCSVHCNAGCTADCTSHCDDGDTTCSAKCEGVCQAQCTAKCDAKGSDECADLCGSSCEGICTARANVDCELDCDGSCRTELKGTCEASCTGVDAALFCDGQFISVAQNDVKRCVDFLKVSGVEATLSVSCSDDTCTGTVGGKTASVSKPSGCSVASANLAPTNGSGDAAAWCALLTGAALLVRRERNEKRLP